MIKGRWILPLAGLAVIAMAFGATAADKPVVVIETSMGSFSVELEPEKAPKTVANFLSYVDKEYYNGTVFHRVIPTFMIQGGGMSSDHKEKKTDKPVKNESIVFNKNAMSNTRGTIAMARTGDPNSATSQFFINLFDRNKFLDDASAPGQPPAGYTAFGKVIEGMDVVDKIAKVETGEGLMTDSEGRRAPAEDVPTKAVIIKSIKRKAK
jgi:cyclophilin family peptidyl-prolyl cis-trans isomerase